MGMHSPPHPGGIVKRQCLEPLGLTVTRAANGLGVTRQALSELINEHTGISVGWRLGYQRGLARRQRPGLECRWPTISGVRWSGQRKSLWSNSQPHDQPSVQRALTACSRIGARLAPRGGWYRSTVLTPRHPLPGL